MPQLPPVLHVAEMTLLVHVYRVIVLVVVTVLVSWRVSVVVLLTSVS